MKRERENHHCAIGYESKSQNQNQNDKDDDDGDGDDDQKKTTKPATAPRERSLEAPTRSQFAVKVVAQSARCLEQRRVQHMQRGGKWQSGKYWSAKLKRSLRSWHQYLHLHLLIYLYLMLCICISAQLGTGLVN